MEMVRQSEAIWNGDLNSGQGNITLGSGAFTGPYSFKARTTEQSKQTNPEELIAAAHAGCFSMALSALLTKAGHPPAEIKTQAKVHLSSDANGFFISSIDLITHATVPNITDVDFQNLAKDAKENCPISKALQAVKINFTATLTK